MLVNGRGGGGSPLKIHNLSMYVLQVGERAGTQWGVCIWICSSKISPTQRRGMFQGSAAAARAKEEAIHLFTSSALESIIFLQSNAATYPNCVFRG